MNLDKQNNPETLDENKTDNFLLDLPFDFRKRISEITDELNNQYCNLSTEKKYSSYNSISEEDKEFSELDEEIKEELLFNLEIVSLKSKEILEKNNYQISKIDFDTIYNQAFIKIYLENWKNLHINILPENDKVTMLETAFSAKDIQKWDISKFWRFLLKQAKIDYT